MVKSIGMLEIYIVNILKLFLFFCVFVIGYGKILLKFYIKVNWVVDFFILCIYWSNIRCNCFL